MAFTSSVHELADQTWLVKRLENANLDALFSGKERNTSPDVLVVSITDEDYLTLFSGISPLNTAKLMDVIDAILAGNPKAVGVDFDTSAWAISATKYTGKPIVWAREALGEAGSVTMGKALGGAKDVCYGVPAYFPDEDGVVREYKQFIEGADRQYYPSLAFNLVEVSQRGAGACQGSLPNLNPHQSAKTEKVNFRGPKNVFDHLSSGVLLKLTGSKAWVAANPLRDKIVLLGGAYRATRDAYPTPFQYLDGVDIIANTVDMNLPGHKKLRDSPLWLTIAGYAEAVALLAMLYFVPPTWKLLITALTGPVYVVLVSWFAFPAGTFFSFVPCFAGIVIHEVVEYGKEYRHLQREIRELHEQINGVRAAAGPDAARGHSVV